MCASGSTPRSQEANVDYHPASVTYELTPEQAAILADDTSPLFLPHDKADADV
jgi:hypothetical protein